MPISRVRCATMYEMNQDEGRALAQGEADIPGYILHPGDCAHIPHLT
jgi:hypothetical protein